MPGFGRSSRGSCSSRGRDRGDQAAAEEPKLAVGQVISGVRPIAGSPGLSAVKIGRRTVAKVRDQDVARLDLHAGQELTVELVREIEQSAAIAMATVKALRLIMRRPMTKKAVMDKLRTKGVFGEHAKVAAEELEKRGLIDDARLGEALAQTELSRKPAGRMLIESKLRARGVDAKLSKSIAQDATSGPDYNPREQALALAVKRARTLTRFEPKVAQRRLYGQLARRGFDPETCRWAVEKALKGESD